MKKQILTIAIILGLGLTSFADPKGGGLFLRGDNKEASGLRDDDPTPMLPAHNQPGDSDAPLDPGIARLTALGGAYLVAKRRKED